MTTISAIRGLNAKFYMYTENDYTVFMYDEVIVTNPKLKTYNSVGTVVSTYDSFMIQGLIKNKPNQSTYLKLNNINPTANYAMVCDNNYYRSGSNYVCEILDFTLDNMFNVCASREGISREEFDVAITEKYGRDDFNKFLNNRPDMVLCVMYGVNSVKIEIKTKKECNESFKELTPITKKLFDEIKADIDARTKMESFNHTNFLVSHDGVYEHGQAFCVPAYHYSRQPQNIVKKYEVVCGKNLNSYINQLIGDGVNKNDITVHEIGKQLNIDIQVEVKLNF